MLKHPLLLGTLLLAAGAFAVAASGCELLTNVDRSQLQGNGGYGTGTTTTTTTTTVTGTCESGGAACSVASDCPGPSSSCVTATCNAGCCGTSNVASGMSCDDPGGHVCDGSGKCLGCLAATDCPAQATKCLDNTCDGTAHTCGTSPATSGTACTDNGGQVCDGSGKCVTCVAAADCPAAATLCKLPACNATAHTCGLTNAPLGTTCSDNNGVVCNGHGTCVSAHCTDGVQDGDESDVDCGGSCGVCNDAQKCFSGADCQNQVCTGASDAGAAGADGGTEGICAYPSCNDGIRNGTETDVDCGGVGYTENDAAGTVLSPCSPCADKLHCQQDSDCANAHCYVTGVCVSCMDGVQDGDETDLDCGGSYCDSQNKLCANTKACNFGSDCVSGYCPNGACAGLSNGQSCSGNAQCANSNCITTGAGQICCSSACTGACQGCLNSQTGQPDGTCSALPTGTTCTSSSDPSALVCGDTTVSAIAGTCVECNQDSDCAALAADAGTGGTDGGDDGGDGGPDGGSGGTALTCNTSTGTCQ